MLLHFLLIHWIARIEDETAIVAKKRNNIAQCFCPRAALLSYPCVMKCNVSGVYAPRI